MSERTAHKKYYTKAAFSLFAAMLVLFYECKQLSHTEKDKHDFEPTNVDTTIVVQERIIDTITLAADTTAIADTIPAMDSLAFRALDSINQTQGIASLQDSLQHDTLTQKKHRRITPKRSESAIETKVICSAVDSSYRDMNKKKIFYYGQAEAKYDDITLTAACLR